MDFFTDELWGNSEISQMPDLFQGNGEQLNQRLRGRIFNGEPCEYSEDLWAALKKYTDHDRIINYFIIILLSSFVIGTIIKFIQSGKELSVWLFVILSAVMIIISVFVCREIANNTAVRAADRGEVQCFRYTLRRKLRYVLDPQDGTCFYFADLGDFMVRISANAELNARPCGLVINIKGSEHFYLLV